MKTNKLKKQTKEQRRWVTRAARKGTLCFLPGMDVSDRIKAHGFVHEDDERLIVDLKGWSCERVNLRDGRRITTLCLECYADFYRRGEETKDPGIVMPKDKLAQAVEAKVQWGDVDACGKLFTTGLMTVAVETAHLLSGVPREYLKALVSDPESHISRFGEMRTVEETMQQGADEALLGSHTGTVH